MALDPKKLGRRALTASGGIAVMLCLIFVLPKWCMHLFLLACGIIGVFEFEAMAKGFGYRLYRTPPLLAVVGGIATLYIPWLDLMSIVWLCFASATLISLIPPSDMKKCMPQVGISLVASAYLGLAVVSISYLVSMTATGNDMFGRYLVLFAVGIVWSGDSLAYIGGSAFGKTKIAPVVSPNKTYEGTVANILGNFIWAIIAKYTYLPQLTLLDTVILSLIFGLLGFFGDLVESSWKRGSDVKDSGTLFPGHGGILDRLDSIFLTIPLFYAYVGRFVNAT